MSNNRYNVRILSDDKKRQHPVKHWSRSFARAKNLADQYKGKAYVETNGILCYRSN